MADQPRGLIEVLEDPTATVAERDDAAIYLGERDEPEALAALIRYATNPALDPTADYLVLASAGESIAEIWIRTGRFDANTLNQLVGAARSEAVGSLQLARPDWVKRSEAA